MGEPVVLTFDVGTQSVKALLIDKSGHVVAQTRRVYETPYYSLQPNWAEQDPEQYWQGVCDVTHQVLEHTGVAPDTVAGMAFGTQWKGIIPIDKDGNVLHNSIIWQTCPHQTARSGAWPDPRHGHPAR